MRVISKKKLREFWEHHSDARESLEAWYREAEDAAWASPQAIKDRYRHASVLPDNRVVFNIKGNSYRLIVRVLYDFQTVYIRFVGTHAEYDKIDATEI